MWKNCFNLLHTILGQVDYFILLIYYEIAGLLDLLAHDGMPSWKILLIPHRVSN